MAVTGIGGFLFRARDPEALGRWYADLLGVGGGPYGAWSMAAGPSVFAPLPLATDQFPADRPWMLTLRVDDLAALIDRLRAAGVAVTTDPAWDLPEVGRFARFSDPEGNPLEAWQPAADAGD